MEDKIEVGEFVRTKKGQIDKLHCEINADSWRSKDEYGNIIVRCEKDKYRLEDIVKHSKNIIDLIEVGDYVNGELVVGIYDIVDENENIISKKITTQYRTAQCNGLNSNYYIYNNDIKSIVTKEQFSSVAYKIEED